MAAQTGTEHRAGRRWVLAALGIVVLVVVAAAIWASGDPDGLERVAEDLGFLEVAEDSPIGVIADYVFPGLDGPLATIVAGLVGVAIVFGLAWLLGRALARRRSTPSSDD
jgi:hypothetical protein